MSRQPAEFDAFAGSYEEDLARGLELTGESKSYFAEGRIAWVAKWLARLDHRAGRVLDYGCGLGDAAPGLLGLDGASEVVGVDPSEEILERARSAYGSDRTAFEPLKSFTPDGSFGLAFCNGVFHHIPVAERPACVALVRDALRPGGLFAFWENNPLNPGTRWVMRRVAFDRDAVMLRAREARRLLERSGFEILGTDFLFVFPRVLRSLRPLEPMLSRLPLGGQYLVLARRS